MHTQFIKELINLPHFIVEESKKPDQRWILTLCPVPMSHLCPVCLGQTNRMCLKHRRLIHSFTPQTGLIEIEVPHERRYCRSCGATHTVTLPGIPDRGIATDAFRSFIVQECQGRAIAEVARRFGLAYTTVERWFYAEAPSQLPLTKPIHIGVDDFAMRKGHSYGVSILDLDTGHVLDVADGRKESSIRSLLKKVASSARLIVSDAAPAMAKAIQHACPSAIHVLDRFHVIQFFTEALNRRRKYLSLSDRKHGSVRRVLRLLCQPPEKLSGSERQEVRDWCGEDEIIRALYQALQHIRYVLKSRTPKVAEHRLSHWFKRFSFHQASPVRKIAKTLILRQESLLAAAVHPHSNGKVEGINNKIKLLKRRAYGYRNMERFKLRIRLETGCLI